MPNAAFAFGDTEAERVDALYQKGDSALERNDYQAAYEAYSEAWKLRQTFDIATNLGQTELELGKARDAAEHLAAALSGFPPSQKDDRRQKVRELLRRAKTLVGTVKLEISPSKAEVYIDNRLVGAAEDLPAELYVEPGQRNISVRLQGYSGMDRFVDAEASKVYQLGFELTERLPSSGLELGQSAGVPVSPKPDERKSLIPVYVGAGLTLASVGAGLGFTLAANGRERDADAIAIPGENGCTGSGSAECSALRSIFEDVDAHRDRATVGFVAGGVFAAATLTYWLWPDSTGSKAARWRAAPVALQGGGGLSIAGRF